MLSGPDWSQAKVLDFGGNRGATLASGRIKESNYWCLDVSRDAIERGKQEFPQAHWIFYNRYNFHFNPDGIEGLKIPIEAQKFDIILAYSVFTHTSKAEMIELTGALRGLLAENGKLAFTFIDQHYQLPENYSDLLRGKPTQTNLRLRLEKIKLQNLAVPVEEVLWQAANSEWCTVVNDGDIYVNHENIGAYSVESKKLYDTFYSPELIARIFPEAVILPPPRDYDTGGSEMQHCCVLGPPNSRQHS
jgi:hypothetical protein